MRSEPSPTRSRTRGQRTATNGADAGPDLAAGDKPPSPYRRQGNNLKNQPMCDGRHIGEGCPSISSEHQRCPATPGGNPRRRTMPFMRKIVTALAIGVLAAVSMSSLPSIADKAEISAGGGGGELPTRMTPLW